MYMSVHLRAPADEIVQIMSDVNKKRRYEMLSSNASVKMRKL